MDVRRIIPTTVTTHIMMEFVDKNGRLQRVPVIIDVISPIDLGRCTPSPGRPETHGNPWVRAMVGCATSLAQT